MKTIIPSSLIMLFLAVQTGCGVLGARGVCRESCNTCTCAASDCGGNNLQYGARSISDEPATAGTVSLPPVPPPEDVPVTTDDAASEQSDFPVEIDRF